MMMARHFAICHGSGQADTRLHVSYSERLIFQRTRRRSNDDIMPLNLVKCFPILISYLAHGQR